MGPYYMLLYSAMGRTKVVYAVDFTFLLQNPQVPAQEAYGFVTLLYDLFDLNVLF